MQERKMPSYTLEEGYNVSGVISAKEIEGQNYISYFLTINQFDYHVADVEVQVFERRYDVSFPFVCQEGDGMFLSYSHKSTNRGVLVCVDVIEDTPEVASLKLYQARCLTEIARVIKSFFAAHLEGMLLEGHEIYKKEYL